MGKKLYVGNLSYSIRDNDLQQAFGEYGTVASANLCVGRCGGAQWASGGAHHTRARAHTRGDSMSAELALHALHRVLLMLCGSAPRSRELRGVLVFVVATSTAIPSGR